MNANVASETVSYDGPGGPVSARVPAAPVGYSWGIEHLAPYERDHWWEIGLYAEGDNEFSFVAELPLLDDASKPTDVEVTDGAVYIMEKHAKNFT